MLASMFDLGLTRADIRHRARLSDPSVLRRAGRHLRFNRRDDLVLSMHTWAEILEESIVIHEIESVAR